MITVHVYNWVYTYMSITIILHDLWDLTQGLINTKMCVGKTFKRFIFKNIRSAISSMLKILCILLVEICKLYNEKAALGAFHGNTLVLFSVSDLCLYAYSAV